MSNTEKKGLTKEEVIAVITQEIPRLISEQPEVRYELIGVMSEVFIKKDEYTKILSEIKALREASDRHTQEIAKNTQEIKALREDFNVISQEIKALREASDRHTQEIKALREDFNTMSQEIKALREASDRHTQEIKALREDFNTMSQEIKALREASDRHTQEIAKNTQEIKGLRNDFNDLRNEMYKGFRNMDNKIGGLGARWGLMSEEAFRNGLKAILTEEIGLKVERYKGYDKEGYVFGQPDQIEIDIIVKDGVLILVEIKSSMSKGDVYTFQRKVEFYEEKHNVKISRKVIISSSVDPRAVPAAQSLGMEVYTSALDAEI